MQVNLNAGTKDMRRTEWVPKKAGSAAGIPLWVKGNKSNLFQ